MAGWPHNRRDCGQIPSANPRQVLLLTFCRLALLLLPQPPQHSGALRLTGLRKKFGVPDFRQKSGMKGAVERQPAEKGEHLANGIRLVMAATISRPSSDAAGNIEDFKGTDICNSQCSFIVSTGGRAVFVGAACQFKKNACVIEISRADLGYKVWVRILNFRVPSSNSVFHFRVQGGV